ncbi:hypothetical protein [Actinomadura roseirufa]|uniref:hypothetical protein n=1 Tax=Actinomadura roseirufa TaxID=2094049 RepID=UPI0010416549|nr:hypothetical protein [Actinomadura roseirufa]
MRRVLVGVLIVTALAGLGLGHARAAGARRDCGPESGTRVARVLDAVTDVVTATARGSFCPPRPRRPGA